MKQEDIDVLLTTKQEKLKEAAANCFDDIRRDIRVWVNSLVSKKKLKLPKGKDREDFIDEKFHEAYKLALSPDQVCKYNLDWDPMAWLIKYTHNVIRGYARDEKRSRQRRTNHRYATLKPSIDYANGDKINEPTDRILARLSDAHNGSKYEQAPHDFEADQLKSLGSQHLVELLKLKLNNNLPLDEEVDRFLALGPKKYADVLDMKYRQGLSVKEIATRIGKTEDATRKHLQRARVYYQRLDTQRPPPTGESG